MRILPIFTTGVHIDEETSLLIVAQNLKNTTCQIELQIFSPKLAKLTSIRRHWWEILPWGQECGDC